MSKYLLSLSTFQTLKKGKSCNDFDIALNNVTGDMFGYSLVKDHALMLKTLSTCDGAGSGLLNSILRWDNLQEQAECLQP